VEAHRDGLIAGWSFVAVAGMPGMRRCLTRPSSVRARLDDAVAVATALDPFPKELSGS
jgi:hypothetical protein